MIQNIQRTLFSNWLKNGPKTWHLTKENIHMANKHIKRFSTEVIREMQIKTVRHHYLSIRVIKIWITTTTKCWWGGCGATETLTFIASREPLWKIVGLIKLNLLLLFNPAIMLLDNLPKEVENLCQHKTYIQMFTAVLFILESNQDVL